jgi:hypothetical protein
MHFKNIVVVLFAVHPLPQVPRLARLEYNTNVS